MIATGEDLDAALVAVALLVGLLIKNDPWREELLKSFRMSLEGLEEEPAWKEVAIRAKIHGETLLASLQMQTSSAEKEILSKLCAVAAVGHTRPADQSARHNVVYLNVIQKPEQADDTI